MADDILARAADGVADGTSVDWPALQGLARSDEERAELKWLQVLGALANVHRSGPSDEPIAETNVTTVAPAVVAPGIVDSVWGRYRLVRELGAGGFGSVYSAWDPQLERHVAIKVLHAAGRRRSALQATAAAGRARAGESAVTPTSSRCSASRRTPTASGCAWSSSPARRWRDVLRTHGLMSHREAVVVGIEVARALAAVHAAGYVHRDVKAQNVMRDRTGKIVLMDFGTGYDLAGAIVARGSGRHAGLHGAGTATRRGRDRSEATSTPSASCSITWCPATIRSRVRRWRHWPTRMNGRAAASVDRTAAGPADVVRERRLAGAGR